MSHYQAQPVVSVEPYGTLYVAIDCDQHGHSRRVWTREQIDKNQYLSTAAQRSTTFFQRVALDEHRRLHEREHLAWRKSRRPVILTATGTRTKRRRRRYTQDIRDGAGRLIARA